MGKQETRPPVKPISDAAYNPVGDQSRNFSYDGKPLGGISDWDTPLQTNPNYTPNIGYTGFNVQYSLESSNPTSLILISHANISLDQNNNYILPFNAQFSSANTYYIYLTDLNNNIIFDSYYPNYIAFTNFSKSCMVLSLIS